MKRMTSLTLLVVLLFAALPQTSVLAGVTNQDLCGGWFGTWEGDDPYDGRCLIPPGSSYHDAILCGDDAYLVVDFMLGYNIYCEAIPVASTGGSAGAGRSTAPHCGPVDLPRTLNPSSNQTISFKGNHLVEGAWLSIPGYDLIPVMDLVFDPDTNTWTGTVDTAHIAEGYYTPLRLLVNGRDQTKACHFGGAVVE
jgi:hypothetical protein